MALIDVSQMKLEGKERNTVHDTVKATYTIFEKDGKKYFQIDTYGRPNRDIPDKISQTIQLDRKSAINLIELLANVFSDN